MNLLNNRNSANCLAGMAFATSCNTGHKTAACIEIQNQVGIGLVWAACITHAGEIVLTDVWDDIKIESRGPKISLLQRFKNNSKNICDGFDIFGSHKGNSILTSKREDLTLLLA